MSGAGSDALRVQYRPATFARTRTPLMPPIAERGKARRAPRNDFGASCERFGASKRKGLAGPRTRQVLNSARILSRGTIVRRARRADLVVGGSGVLRSRHSALAALRCQTQRCEIPRFVAVRTPCGLPSGPGWSFRALGRQLLRHSNQNDPAFFWKAL